MEYIKKVEQLKYHIGRIKKLETINDKLELIEQRFNCSPSPIKVIEIQLLYEQMNKILSGNTVKLVKVCPDPTHYAMEIGLLDKCDTCGATE